MCSYMYTHTRRLYMHVYMYSLISDPFSLGGSTLLYATVMAPCDKESTTIHVQPTIQKCKLNTFIQNGEYPVLQVLSHVCLLSLNWQVDK